MVANSAKYEALELEPEDGLQVPRRHSPSVLPSFPSSPSTASSLTQRRALLIGAIAAVAFYTLLALFSGSSKEEKDHFIQSQIIYPTLANDHYKKPGILQFDRNDYRPAWRRARWIPLDEHRHLDELSSTGRNGLERDYHLGDGFDLLESIHGYLKDHPEEATPSKTKLDNANIDIPSQFDYLRNKTILVLGDGNDRNSLDYACDHLLAGRRTMRKYTEQPIDLLDKSSDKIARDPHVCELPNFLQGTTIWSFMTYSILATEDTFAVPLDEVRPRQYLPRLDQIVGALNKANVKPDMVVVHSTLWDLDAINYEDAFINLPPTEMLSIARLATYRTELREALTRIDEYFPNAKKLYRTLQATKADRGDWWMPHMPPGTQPFPRVPYTINKGQQLNTITMQVLVEMGWPIFDFHRVTSGYMEDYEGSVHVGSIGKTIWMQMILYYLNSDLKWY